MLNLIKVPTPGSRSRRGLGIGLILILCVAFLVSPLRAADESSADQIPDVGEENGGYCGIYCVYAAVNGLGRTMDFRSLLKTRYVGTLYGSSIHELALAVEDHGLHALPMMGLSRANLLASQCPIVLHVSRPSTPGYFGHWILFLGMEDGQAKIVDAPHRPERVPIADLLAQWDGVGLYISEKSLSPWRLKAEAILTGENMALFAALLVASAVIQRVVRRSSLAGRSSRWAIPALLVAPAMLAAGWHFASDDGYARNPVAIRTVIQQHRPSFLPKLGVTEMQRAMQDKTTIIVDARYPRDFKSGHLPGAINIPVFTTQAERRKLLGNVPRDARVIVYCQSDSCEFDEALGSALVAEGIENVSLFPGGWSQWETDARPTPDKSAPPSQQSPPSDKAASQEPKP